MDELNGIVAALGIPSDWIQRDLNATQYKLDRYGKRILSVGEPLFLSWADQVAWARIILKSEWRILPRSEWMKAWRILAGPWPAETSEPELPIPVGIIELLRSRMTVQDGRAEKGSPSK